VDSPLLIIVMDRNTGVTRQVFYSARAVFRHDDVEIHGFINSIVRNG
jgi:hypothetical protein